MKPSRQVLLPVLAAVLLVAIGLAWRLAIRPAGENGSGAILEAAGAEPGGEQATDLRAPPRDPSALPTPEPENEVGQAGAAGAAEPPEPVHTVHGRVILVDGGALPAHLALHASRVMPWPRLSSMREMINRGEDADDGTPLPDNLWAGGAGQGSGMFAALAKASRVEVSPDLTFSMPGVPDAGAWVAVEDDVLFVDPAARLAPGADSVEVRLRRGATIRGLVTDPSGAPLADAGVAGGTVFDPFSMFDHSSRMVALEQLTTDTGGHFLFTQVPTGETLKLTAGKRAAKLQASNAEVAPLLPGEARVVDLQLRVASSIAGHVRKADGAALPAARVELQRTDFNMKEMSLAGMALDDRTNDMVTDETGAFLFEGLADGSYEARLNQGDYRQTHVSVPKLTAGQAIRDVELVAEIGLPVSGTVVDAAGVPVPKADVKGFVPPGMMDMRANLDRARRPSVASDDAGHFALAGFDPGKVRVRATADGFLPAQTDVQAGDTGVALTLERTCALTGIVVSKADGEPVTRFTIGVMPAGGLFDLSDPLGMADRMEGAHPNKNFHDREDGTFTVEELRPGAYDVSANAQGFGAVMLKGVDIGKDGRRGLIVMLPPEAAVSGNVVDAHTGLAVEGARISTVRGSMMENMVAGMLEAKPEAETDARGHFRLGGLSQDPVKLAIQHTEYRDLAVPELVLGPGEQRDLGVLSLASGGAIFGKVTDALGQPVPGVKVMVSEATGRSIKRATTDEAGSYRVGGLPAGSFNVMRMDFNLDMGGDGGSMNFLKDMVFELVTLQADQEREVNLHTKSASGTRVFGDVLAAGGAVPGAMVTLLPEHGSMSGISFANTDKEGRYELTGVKSGVYALQVVVLDGMTAAGGGPTSSPVIEKLTVAGAEQRHDLRLPGGVINGVVESTADGSHVPGVRVILERTDDGLPHVGLLKATGGRVAELYTNKDGAFSFRYLPDGTFTVVAGGKNIIGMGAGGWAVARVPDVRVTGGGAGFTLHVKVAPGGVIAGRVTDTAGSPLPGVSLWFMDSAGRWQSRFSESTTDAGGAYAVDSLGQGLWSVAFRDGTHALRIVSDVDVHMGQTTPLDVALEPGISLSLGTGSHDPWALQVTLDGPDGPLPTELVSMDQIMGSGDEGVVMKLGVFAPGSYHLRVIEGPESVLDTTVVLVGGSGTKVVTLGS